MQINNLFVLLTSSLYLAYNPSASDILSRMETVLRRSEPVMLQVVRETPDASLQSEHRIRVPANLLEEAAADDDVPIPFSSLTLPLDEVANTLPSLFDDDVVITLDRFKGFICYLLEGSSEKIWLRKSDFIPLKVETLSSFDEKITHVYMGFVDISEKNVYPSRTEILLDGSLVMVERLAPARAGTDEP